jgi:EAL domain-containing protein (putative c-di-GMP-specific phosphodiesterase class I)
VKLAFDDFGTGFASLRYLTLFPVSRIKIDRTFIKGGAYDPKSATIVRSLLSNLFPRQIRDPSLIEDVEAALRNTELAPEFLELEITEDIALNYEEAAKPLARHGPEPRPRGHRRRRGDERSICVAEERTLRRSTGLPIQ